MLKDFFFADRNDVTATEIPSEKEVKTADELKVGVPADNANFNSLARRLAASLPRDAAIPTRARGTRRLARSNGDLLRETVHAHSWDLAEIAVGTQKVGPWNETDYWLRIGGMWTVPAIELAPATPKGTVIVLADGGRVKAAEEVTRLLKDGAAGAGGRLVLFRRIEDSPAPTICSRSPFRAWANGRWDSSEPTRGHRAVDPQKVRRAAAVVALGPRSSLIATGGRGPRADGDRGTSICRQPLNSLKDVIEKNLTLDRAPRAVLLRPARAVRHAATSRSSACDRFAEMGPLDDFLPERQIRIKSPKSKRQSRNSSPISGRAGPGEKRRLHASVARRGTPCRATSDL